MLSLFLQGQMVNIFYVEGCPGQLRSPAPAWESSGDPRLRRAWLRNRNLSLCRLDSAGGGCWPRGTSLMYHLTPGPGLALSAVHCYNQEHTHLLSTYYSSEPFCPSFAFLLAVSGGASVGASSLQIRSWSLREPELRGLGCLPPAAGPAGGFHFLPALPAAASGHSLTGSHCFEAGKTDLLFFRALGACPACNLPRAPGLSRPWNGVGIKSRASEPGSRRLALPFPPRGTRRGGTGGAAGIVQLCANERGRLQPAEGTGWGGQPTGPLPVWKPHVDFSSTKNTPELDGRLKSCR